MLGFNLGASLYMPVDHPDTVDSRLDDFADRFLWGNLRYFVVESNQTHESNFEPNDYVTGTYICNCVYTLNQKYVMMASHNTSI